MKIFTFGIDLKPYTAFQTLGFTTKDELEEDEGSDLRAKAATTAAYPGFNEKRPSFAFGQTNLSGFKMLESRFVKKKFSNPHKKKLIDKNSNNFMLKIQQSPQQFYASPALDALSIPLSPSDTLYSV